MQHNNTADTHRSLCALAIVFTSTKCGGGGGCLLIRVCSLIRTNTVCPCTIVQGTFAHDRSATRSGRWKLSVTTAGRSVGRLVQVRRIYRPKKQSTKLSVSFVGGAEFSGGWVGRETTTRRVNSRRNSVVFYRGSIGSGFFTARMRKTQNTLRTNNGRWPKWANFTIRPTRKLVVHAFTGW